MMEAEIPQNNPRTPSNNAQLALFDFDGTLTRSDSFRKFMDATVSTLALKYYQLSTVIPLCKELCKKEPPGFWRDALFKKAFGGLNTEEFKSIALSFYDSSKDTIFYRDALKKLNEHKKQNTKTIIVSANIDLIVEPFAKALGCELIATTAEIKDNRLTGRMATPSCHGTQKVIRIKESLNIENFDYIYAYGDSSGDLEMLQMATESHFRLFND